MVPHPLSLTCEELAQLLGARLVRPEGVEGPLQLDSASDLEEASFQDVSFFYQEKYRPALERTQAGAIIAAKVESPQLRCCWLLHENPSLAFQKALEHFLPLPDQAPYSGIDPTARVDPSATLEEGVTLGPYVVVGPRAHLGRDCYIGPLCSIGADVTLGEQCLLHPGVILREGCRIGDRVIFQPGAIIGACGFGYLTQEGRHSKLQQLAGVVIEDEVEIGAGCCIDRGRFKDTRIGRGSKIDNLVMIGHGAQVGPDNLIVAQTGIAGSSRTGRWVVLGGQVGVAGHLKIGDGVQVAAQSGVTKNLEAGRYGGTPAEPLRQWHESRAHLRTIVQLKAQIQQLQQRLDALESR